MAVLLLISVSSADAASYAWHTFYGSSSIDGSMSIATDGSGNVYTMGYSYATWNGPAGESPLHAYSEGTDIFVLKLDSSGAYQWHTFYGSSGEDYGSGIAIDGSGNLYVTGFSWATWNGPAGQNPLHPYSGYDDIFVLKLDSSGTYQWHTFYGSTNIDYGNAIAIDGSGNLYVTGGSSVTWNGPADQSPLHAHSGSGDKGYWDIFVLKLDSSGAYQWHTFYGTNAGGNESNGIATDGGGNIYVTGHSYAIWNGPAGQNPLHPYSGDYDIFVLKLNSSGAYQWHTFYGSSSADYSWGIANDASGNVYVTGRSDASWNGPAAQSPFHAHSGSWDILVLKLSSSGVYQWHTFYGSSSPDYSYGIATDVNGNVYVTGSSYASWNGPAAQSPLHAHSGGSDIFVLKLSGAPVSCDFDGDRKTDIGLYRQSIGAWYIVPSSTGVFYFVGFGGDLSDIPVPGDYDGDGKTDIALYRQSIGAWYIVPSSTGVFYFVGFGGAASDIPVPGDYDGDGKTDIALYRQSIGAWYIVPSSTGVFYFVGFGGAASDIPVPADYDGDGKTDIAVYRQSIGVWFVLPSSTGVFHYGGICYVVFGGDPSDIPVPGDYDKDGKADIALYRQGIGAWYIVPSSTGVYYSVGFGGDSSDVPITGNRASY